VLGMSGSLAGIENAAVGAGVIGAIGFGFRFGAAFFATGLIAGLTFFFGAAFTAFFATFFATFFADFAFTLFLALAFTFIGRFFNFPALFFFAAGRFLDLLFFAMINLLLEIVRTRCESSPEKVCCHLCMMLETFTWIA
jgi:hypothetical protein